MADISLPAGAFAAIKSGQPVPQTAPKNDSTPKTELNRVTEPVTKTRKAMAEESTHQENVSKKEPPIDMIPAEKKIWKLKADGEEFEFDASDEEAIKRQIMKARGADKRFETAAHMRQEAEQFLNMLKDPQSLRKVLEDPRIGIDLKKFAKDYVWEMIQEEKMTPEQKAQRQRDRELEQLKAEKEARERQSKEAESQQRQAQHEQFYENKIMQALQVKGVPQTSETVKAMADYIMTAIEQGIDLSPDEIAHYVKNNTGSYLKSYAQHLNEDQLLEFLGDEIAEKLRKADLKRLKTPQSNPFPQRSKAKKEAYEQKQKRLGAHEWKADLIKGFLARK